LTPAQLQEFVDRAHARHLKAGIYYSPFVGWGNLDDQVRGTAYHYQDLVLKGANGAPRPRLDGGYSLDPTHPGTLQRIDLQLADFVKEGFDYVKLDFLTHGALEGRHFDSRIQTGTQAYIVGMKRVVADLSAPKSPRPVFLSLSIAPMFPNGFGHSRRVSCDVFANIGATEYFLNSANYGWWTGGTIYRFNDPDSACVYQPLGEPPISEAESRSRFTASVIGGGIMIEGDNLTEPKAIERVLHIYSNRELLNVAAEGKPFRPLNGDVGSKAGDQFYRLSPEGSECYVALFNFDHDKPKAMEVDLDRIGLQTGSWAATELWSGKEVSFTGRKAKMTLGPMDCAVIQMRRG
jgi:hypothetical protein